MFFFMKSTGGHSECLCLSLYADLLRCTALIALLCPPHLISRCINCSGVNSGTKHSAAVV